MFLMLHTRVKWRVNLCGATYKIVHISLRKPVCVNQWRVNVVQRGVKLSLLDVACVSLNMEGQI